MRDVAALAHVSPMTVSRALRDPARVSAEARDRVLAAVASLGYRRNEAARSLRQGQMTGMIGLVVTNLANPFYSRLALGVEAAASEHGMQVVIANTGEDERRERELVSQLAGRRVEGMITVPAGADHEHLRAAALSGVPVVMACRPPVGIDADCVLVDDFGGAREAARTLIAAGHRRIAFVGNPPAVYTGAERFRGFCVALDEAGIALEDRYVRRAQQDIESAETATSEILHLHEPPTAIFAANNRNTIGAFRAINRHGRDTALCGFDDFELADVLGLPLTVVSYDPDEVGRQAEQLLLDRLQRDSRARSEPPRRIVVPTKIIEYGSSCRPVTEW